MGVPTVTLLGDGHRSRVGASLLTRVGCTDLIARDHDDYVRIAAALAADPARQAALRQTLRARMAASSLCDAPGFARKIEAEYRAAWRHWCESTNIAVPEFETSPARQPELSLALSNGVTLAVPPTLDSITTYVLLEQGNWFEKEVGFVSRWLRPGMTAIDIGACLGVYSLPMARDVGPDGHVFAYEPASAAFGLLTRSRTINGADSLVLVQAALSDRAGTGWLSHALTPESNTLLGGGLGESVKVTSLDDEDRNRDWGSPDFVKIDVVGNEVAILQGGAAFFERHSPLVMFSVRNDGVDHLPACRIMTSFGYSLYKLLPGEPVLVPYGSDGLDAYEMNLFAAKPDRAASMAAEGWLAETLAEWTPADDDLDQALAPLRRLGCADACAGLLVEESFLDPEYLAGLAAFAVWHSEGEALPVRCAALDFAWRSLLTLNKQSSTVSRLLTLSRVAWEAGERAVSVQALRHFMTATKGRKFVVDEPFWPAAARFDDVVPRIDIQDWIVSTAAEQIELCGHFSSVYTGLSPELEWLSARGFTSDEMERRQVLVAARAAKRDGSLRRLILPGDDRNAGLVLYDGVLSAPAPIASVA
jgi:FkbM family methyltransferase